MIESNISSSTLHIGGDDGYDVNLVKFPIKYKSEVYNRDWTAISLANISIGELKFSNVQDPDNRIDGTLRAYSGSLGAGIRVPLSDTLSSLMLFEFSLSQLTNQAYYIAQDAIENKAPIYNGIIYNWSTNAWNSSVTFGLNYKKQYNEKYLLDILGIYTYSYISSFNGSEDFVNFSDNSSTITVKMDFTQALNFSLFDHPVYGTTHLSSTNFVGSNSDILIFSNYLQFSYSMKIVLRRENKEMKGFKLGLQLLRGNNIRGYTVSVKYDF